MPISDSWNDYRVNADPVLISQETGLDVAPRQLMENGDWRVAVQGVERVRGDIAQRMMPYLSPTVTGEYRVNADAASIARQTRFTVLTKQELENGDNVVAVSPADRMGRSADHAMKPFISPSQSRRMGHPGMRKVA